MNALISNSHRRVGASLMIAAISFAGLASLATIDTAAAGKGGDNRAPKAAALTTQCQIDRAREVRGDRPEKAANEPCTRNHCGHPQHDHDH